MRRLKKNLSMIFRGIQVLLEIEKAYIVLLITTSILSSLIPFINIFMMARIVNELVGKRGWNIALLFAAIAVGLNAGLTLLLHSLNHLKDYHMEQFFKNEKLLFSKKSMDMDYAQIEKQETTLLRERINIESQTGYNTYFLYTSLGKWVANITNIIASAALTLGFFFNHSIHWSMQVIMAVIMAVVIVVGFITSKQAESLTQNMFGKFVPYNMLYNFYNDYLKNYNTGKDVRLYHMEELVADEQKQLNLLTYKIEADTKKHILKYMLANSFTADILKIFSYIIMTLSCLSGAIPVGNIIQYVTCMALFVSSVSEILNQTQMLFYNNRYLEHYFQYLDLPSQIYQGKSHIPNSLSGHVIEFHHVSFRYPQSDVFAIKDLSLIIYPGTRMAVVGMNGSGKTTMIKLLCRLYDPTEGYITLDGVDIRDIDYHEYLHMWGIVFQDFKLFSLPIGQNVASGTQYEAKKVEDALIKVGLEDFIHHLPRGFQTSLYKDFDEDGYEISGGEAQKIAFARALYKDSLFLILDEPTAALDPIAEAQVYTQFDHTVGDKTAVYISHRLSSCKFCDIIAVFHEGVLIQYGTHEELLGYPEGKYYELWQAQSQHYK